MDKKSIFLISLTVIGLLIWLKVAPIIEQKLGWTKPVQQIPIENVSTENTQPITKAGEVKTLDGKNTANSAAETKSTTENKVVDTVKNTEEILTKAVVNEDVPVEILKTELFTIEVNPNKGIGEINLLQHKQTMEDNSPNIIIGDRDFQSLTLTGIADTWTYGTPVVSKTEKSVSITRPVIGKNFSIQQEIILEKDYQFKKVFRIINDGDAELTLANLAIIAGQIKPVAFGEVGMMAGMDQGVDIFNKTTSKIETHFFEDIVKQMGKNETEKGLKPGQGKYFLEQSNLQWIAVKNRYFAWIIDYEDGFDRCEVSYNSKEVESHGKLAQIKFATANGYFKTIQIKANSTHEIVLNCYAGPQQYTILKKLNHDKKEIMQLNVFMWTKVSWIGAISEWLLIALLYFHQLVGNYGLAIIMLTIVVKALFWRLTNKSTESMKKMSALSPKMKEINEKYKDNPQVKQQEIMKLYREAGVNPVAGCLPLLLQMPVFFVLFNALRGAIELRHSEFLWAADLSHPDTVFDIFGLPIRPLAIAWAVSMFLQQKIVPSTADETQRKIMMFMPFFMLFVCYGMPSGLTLYWTFSTLMSILQYYLNNKKASKIDGAKVTAKTTA